MVSNSVIDADLEKSGYVAIFVKNGQKSTSKILQIR